MIENIYIVCVSSVESTDIVSVHRSKDEAVKVLLKERDKLVEHWKMMVDMVLADDSLGERDMYSKMIDNLSHDGYEKWDNYPHEVPHIIIRQLLE